MRWRPPPRRRRGARSPTFLDANIAQRAGSGSGSTRSTAPENEKDLDAILPAHPDGIVLPKAEGGASVDELARRLTERGNATAQILAIATETPAAIFALGTYGGAKRLAGLTWGAEDLPAAIGAATSARGGRALHAALRACPLALPVRRGGGRAWRRSRPSIRPFATSTGSPLMPARARRDGFTGMMAIHPDQVAVINAAFTPSEAEIAHARAVVAAFEANPGAGALSLDGRMIDRPHLLQAQRILSSL